MRYVLTLVMTLFLSCCGLFGDSGIPLFTSFSGDGQDYVTVVKGDTLYSLSKRYNVPLRDMIEVNNLKPPYNLRIGQRLVVPGARYHVVQKGDTLYSISKKYNVDLTSLSRKNSLKAPYTLSIGQRLQLPGRISGASSSLVATSSNVKTNATTTTTAKKSTTTTTASKTTAKKTTASAPAPSQYRKTKFAWPVRGQIISNFGVIGKGRNNDGINIKATARAAIKSADKGTVAYAGSELKGFGNLILIKHDDGWITAYAHNDRLLVKKGQRVVRGEKISTAGSSGGVGACQLHFEVRRGKTPVNPMSYLEK